MIGKNGLELIKEFEGCKLKAYLCPAGKPTVGYGATGNGITLETVWTQREADDDLARRTNIISLWLNGVLQKKATQNQIDAMVSLIYNIGQTAFKNSSVLRHFNAGAPQMAADSFLMWTKATVNGKKVELEGLVRRRKAERELFLKD